MKSTFSVLFYLKRSGQKRNGNMPIMGRITVNGKAVQFGTKVEISPDLWNIETGKVIGKGNEAKEVNTILDSIKAALARIYHDLRERGKDATPESIKNIYFGTEVNQKGLLALFEHHNTEFLSMVGVAKKKSTYVKYVCTKRRLEEFIRDKYNLSDILLKEVQYGFIREFDIYLRTVCRYPQNSTAKHMQRFKTIMILARNNEYIYSDPFAKYKLYFDRIDRGYLTWEELECIMQKKFTIQRLEQVRDIFVFSCFTGLAYADVKNLRKEHISSGFDGKFWITKKREKTGTLSTIPLLENALVILEKYKDCLGDFLLPVLSNQKMNTYLKEIADVCEIDKNLTFHLARHTFATTVTLSKGVPMETVSKMLGHTNIKTTQIYARIIDRKVSEDMTVLSQKLNYSTEFSDLSVQVSNKTNRLDFQFECLTLQEKMDLFNLPATLSRNDDREKRINDLWRTLSEREKTSLWAESFGQDNKKYLQVGVS